MVASVEPHELKSPLVSPIVLQGQTAHFVFGQKPIVKSREVPQDAHLIKGLDVEMESLEPLQVSGGKNDNGSTFCKIEVPVHFPPGSVALFATAATAFASELDEMCIQGAAEAFVKLDMTDLNVMLYRADGEERDVTAGQEGVYVVPGLGALTYCGLEGWMHPLRHIMRRNDLGHPLCAHLRDGSWACRYVYQRLERSVGVSLQCFIRGLNICHSQAIPSLSSSFRTSSLVQRPL